MNKSIELVNLIKIFVRRAWSGGLLLLTAPVVLLAVLVRPFILVRFGILRSERIGHFAADTEAYLCALDHEVSARKRLDIISCPEPVCNHYLRAMWARTFPITKGAWLWRLLDRSCQFWTRGDTHHIKLAGLSKYYKYLLTTPPHLHFTTEEEQRGRALLAQLGIPPDSKWICIHNRDSAYLDQTLGHIQQWSYHDYRDFSVQSMLSAAEELTKRGYFVIRMGSIQSETLSSSNRKIIDYASSPQRSDFGDIYLSSGCSFYIGSDSGIACLPIIFRKPVCYINFTLTAADLIPKQQCYTLPFITKHLFHKEKGRFLSVREMFEVGLYNVGQSHKFVEVGVEVISNTPEEIRDLAIEVDERLKGTWQAHPEDESLQERFWELFRQCAPKSDWGDSKPLIGAAFLRQHQYLLA
ncbi:TIGR04372 family glycosyltransferase [Deltaproteobacteria bacterium TL4]